MKKTPLLFVAALSAFLLVGCGSGDSASDATKPDTAAPAAAASTPPVAVTPAGKSASDTADATN